MNLIISYRKGKLHASAPIGVKVGWVELFTDNLHLENITGNVISNSKPNRVGTKAPLIIPIIDEREIIDLDNEIVFTESKKRVKIVIPSNNWQPIPQLSEQSKIIMNKAEIKRQKERRRYQDKYPEVKGRRKEITLEV